MVWTCGASWMSLSTPLTPVSLRISLSAAPSAVGRTGLPSQPHPDPHAVPGHHRVPGDDAERALRDLIVVLFPVAWQTHLDLHRDGLDALDPLGRLFRGDFLRVVGDMAAEGDHAVLGRNADVGGIDTGFELQLVDDEPAQFPIVHCRSPLVGEWHCAPGGRMDVDPGQLTACDAHSARRDTPSAMKHPGLARFTPVKFAALALAAVKALVGQCPALDDRIRKQDSCHRSDVGHWPNLTL